MTAEQLSVIEVLVLRWWRQTPRWYAPRPQDIDVETMLREGRY